MEMGRISQATRRHRWPANNFIYDRLARALTDELRTLNPANSKGKRLSKHHQWFNPAQLKAHISGIAALMRASSTWDGFKRSLDRACPRYGDTIKMSVDDI